MKDDEQTLAVYDAQSKDYAALMGEQKADPHLQRFIQQLNAGDLVLDLGCGPAYSSATFREQGLRVDPVDGSVEMVKLANKQYAIGARQANFSDIDAVDLYHGVWANFSLLHARAQDFPHILVALHRGLLAAGLLHLGMKRGVGSKRDKLNRYYSYYSEEQLQAHLDRADFDVLHVELGEGLGLAGDVEPWIVLQARARVSS